MRSNEILVKGILFETTDWKCWVMGINGKKYILNSGRRSKLKLKRNQKISSGIKMEE